MSERDSPFSDAERERVEALRQRSSDAWDARRHRFVACSTQGHEDRAASHRASWTQYGGVRASGLLCEDCASRGVGQRGLRIETLPSFRGVGQ